MYGNQSVYRNMAYAAAERSHGYVDYSRGRDEMASMDGAFIDLIILFIVGVHVTCKRLGVTKHARERVG